MNQDIFKRSSQPVTVFRERRLPERAVPTGYAALIDAFNLSVPVPRTLSAIGKKHRTYRSMDWNIYTPRHLPETSLRGHLVFALKHEGVELAVLKQLFLTVSPNEVAAIVRGEPTGSYARRIWFLYEWLLGRRLELADASQGNYVPVVDPERQWDVSGQKSTRHRVTNNLPGTQQFCPLVYRTSALERFTALDLSSQARDTIARVPADLMARTAAFLLLRDSKSSYVIEGEKPPESRIQRWGRALGEAGKHPLDLDELLRLQRIVIGDARFIRLGLRTAGGFVGEHDRDTGRPLPEHISARAEDLASLVEGFVAFARGPATGLHAVISAAMLAFGFVYIHPFADGNGRIHRYLIHHALAVGGFSPTGIVFPVSAAILRHIDLYRRVLEDYSSRLLPVVDWRATADNNIEVLNDTSDFYRYFDATPHAEFLFSCVRQTIEQDLPQEAEFLRRYDQFALRIDAMVDMPARTIDLLFRFLDQNHGHLSSRARRKEFAALSADEVARVEDIYSKLFEPAH